MFSTLSNMEIIFLSTLTVLTARNLMLWVLNDIKFCWLVDYSIKSDLWTESANFCVHKITFPTLCHFLAVWFPASQFLSLLSFSPRPPSLPLPKNLVSSQMMGYINILLLMLNNHIKFLSFLLCPCINRSRSYSFWPAYLSAKMKKEKL